MKADAFGGTKVIGPQGPEGPEHITPIGGIITNIDPSEYGNGLYSDFGNINISRTGIINKFKGWKDKPNFHWGSINIKAEITETYLNPFIASAPVILISTLTSPMGGGSNILGYDTLTTIPNPLLPDSTPTFLQMPKIVRTKENYYLFARTGAAPVTVYNKKFLPQNHNQLNNVADLELPVPNGGAPADVGMGFTSIRINTQPGSLLTGVYSWFFTYILNTGTETLANAPATITMSTQEAVINGTIPMPDSYYVIQIRIYRTKHDVADIYYFVDAVNITPGQNTIWNYKDNTDDIQLTDQYLVPDYVPAHGTDGLYFNSCLHLIGDPATLGLYVSDIDLSDSLRASMIFPIPNESFSNRATAISHIGNTMYIFNENFGISRWTPTGNADIPYYVSEVTKSWGCNGTYCSAGLSIFFMFKGKLFGFGEITQKLQWGEQFFPSDIGAGIQDYIDAGTYFELKYNNKLNVVYFLVKDADYNGLSAWTYDLIHGAWRRIYKDDTTQGDRANAIGSIIYFAEIDKLFALDKNDKLLEEAADWTEPINPLYGVPTASAVKALIVKPLWFGGISVMLNKLTLYGDGNIIIRYKIASGNYSKPIYVALTPGGADVNINAQGKLFYLEISHTEASEFLLKYWTYAFTPLSGQATTIAGTRSK